MRPPVDVHGVRAALGITQGELGALMGVHYVTILRWERDIQRPSPWQQSLLLEFAKAAHKKKDIGTTAIQTLTNAGVAAALLHLLYAAR